MRSFSRRGSRLSLARAQQLGIRTSPVSSWSRSNSFNCAVRATIILIAIIIFKAFLSSTANILLISKTSLSRTNLRQNNSSPRASSSIRSIATAEERHDVCSSRPQHKWRDDISRQYKEPSGGMPTFAVVLTVNNGFWDFFLNWHHHFYKQVANESDQPLLIIIAEDSIIYEKLKNKILPMINSIILPGYDSANDSATDKAEDYDSIAYKSLVSSRATHMLNLMCSLEGGGLDDDLIIVYSDVDTVWLKDPFPYIQTEMFGPNNNDTQMQQHPNYDFLVAVDSDEYWSVSPYYCTGFLVIAQTPASIVFLSHWEKELQSNPQLNQPIFNTLLRSPKVQEIRHGGLGETEFPPGILYFDKWVKEGGDAERRKKKETMVVHSNYIVGRDAKKKSFQERGLWINNDKL